MGSVRQLNYCKMLRSLRMIKMKQCLLLTLLLLVLLCCNIQSFGQSDARELLKRKVDLHVSKMTLVYVIDTLSIDYKIPIGLEKSSTHKDEFNIEINVEGVALREVLDSIVQQEPAYQWQLIDGVINFIPTHDRDSFLVAFLDTPVSRFAPAKGKDTLDVRERILELPAIDSLMISSGIKIDKWWGYSIYSNDTFDLSISNPKVRGILNNVIKVTRAKTWTVNLSGNNRGKLLITF
jgi:hypothetical protein